MSHRISIQKSSETVVEYIVRKVGEKTSNREDCEQYFETMFKNADQENSVGKTFTTSEIGEAFVISMGKFDAAIKGKGKEKGSKKGKPRHVVIEHHGVMFMYHKDFEKSRIWFKQISGRIAQVCFKTKGPNLVITNTLAPHTWKSGDKSRDDMLELRQEFFQSYTEILLEFKDKCLHVAVGDFNTRLHGRLAGEESLLGNHVWGRGVTFLKTQDQSDKEQRALLITTLKAATHVLMNSFFEKTAEKKITRSDWSATGPPYIPQRYAELDFFIANRRSRKATSRAIIIQ